MMTRLIFVLAAMVTVEAQAADRFIFVHAGRLIVQADHLPLMDATLVLRNDRVERVSTGFVDSKSETLPADAKVEVLDFRQQTVLPGLIDTHVHLELTPDDHYWDITRDTESFLAIRAEHHARLTLAAGFTTVRDLGSLPDDIFALRRAIEQGLAVGPRIIAAGAPISIIGGHGDLATGFRPEVRDVVASFSRLCTGADGCARAVREAARSGSDVIKITETGGILSQQSRGLDKQFSGAELDSIVSTAHRIGLKVAAHAHGPEGVRDATRAGVDSIEHGTLADVQGLQLMAARKTIMVPTMMAFKGIEEGLVADRYSTVVAAKARTMLARVGESVRAAHALSVPIAFGTDAGVFEHGRNAEEFELLVKKGGLTPQEAVMTATRTAAQLLGLSGKAGCLAAGCFADFVVVAGNPLSDVSVLTHPVAVFKGGARVIGLTP